MKEAQKGREIKGWPAGVHLCARRCEHVTDEQRRLRTIWGCITILSSRHNIMDVTVEIKTVFKQMLSCPGHLRVVVVVGTGAST